MVVLLLLLAEAGAVGRQKWFFFSHVVQLSMLFLSKISCTERE